MGLTTRKMSDAHEKHLAEVFNGRQTRGSGNQFVEQTDVRQSHREKAVAFAMDGKSTRARSITIKRDDLDKLREQAHGERPMLPIRFYSDDRLRIFEDWDLLREDDMLELVERSEALHRVETLTRLLHEGGSLKGAPYDTDPQQQLVWALRMVLQGTEVHVWLGVTVHAV